MPGTAGAHEGAGAARTLVVAPAWVGDMVMSQPLLEHLAAGDATGRVDVLAPAWTAGLCQRLPGVGRCLETPFGHGGLQLRARWRLGRGLAAAGYRRAFVLPNSFKSALIPRIAGIPERVGYIGESRRLLLTEARRLDATACPRLVDRYLALALPVPPPGAASPVAPDPRVLSEASAQRALLGRLELAVTGPALVLCPGAEFGPAKRWPARYFAQIARAALDRGESVWILGSARDRAIGEAIRAHDAAGAENLCGRTSLADAIDLMAMASAVLTNDSGLMHVAAAVGARTLALFGSSSPAYTPPLSPRATVLSMQLACSPCFRRDCPLGHTDCLMTLLPERVEAALWAAEPDTPPRAA